MDFENKIIVVLITFMLEVFIMNSLTNKLNPFDFYYAVSILVVHILFIIAVFLCGQKVLDIFHYSIFICIALSPFLSNNYLIGANLLLLLLIQLLWIIKGCCILNDPNNPLRVGFGIETSIIALLYTIILANKLPKISINNVIKFAKKILTIKN